MFKSGAYRLVHKTIGPRGLGQWLSLSSINKAFGCEASAAAAAAVAMTTTTAIHTLERINSNKAKQCTPIAKILARQRQQDFKVFFGYTGNLRQGI